MFFSNGILIYIISRRMLKSNQLMYLLDIIPTTKIPHTQQQVFSYFSGQKLPPGALVQIPLGKRKELGIVFDAHKIADYKMELKRTNFELRNISQIVSAKPILTKQQISLALWLGQYYFCSPGLFVKMSLPPYYSSSKPRSSGVRREVLDSAPTTPRSNNKIKQKLILAPTVAQAEKITTGHKDATLWHSGLKSKQLNEVWWQVKNGQAQTIVGTRSAVFLPFTNLKKIIIEDESNSSHKSWDTWPHYGVQAAAKKLAEIFKAEMSLRGGPPWLDDEAIQWQTIKKERDRHVASLRSAPSDNKILIIDMRAELKDGNFSIFSRALQSAIKDTLAQNQQVVLFINRRGAANFILCRDCGYVAKCQQCDAPLAHHLINSQPTLLCHHCGAKDTAPSLCPKCHGSRVKTMGTGTQKVEMEAKKLYPDAGLARLDSDIAPQPKDQQKIIDAFVKKEIDILITTQIIFSWLEETKKAAPNVVAVLSADTLLHLPDFRSGERTWQTIMTLENLLRHSERSEESPTNVGPHSREIPRRYAPRDDKQKTFLVQTYNPDNSVMKYLAKNDWAGFIKEEQETRQALNYPPYSQIVKLTFRHRDGQRAGQEAKILAAKLKHTSSIICHSGESRNPKSGSRVKRGMTNNYNIEISDALPAFIPRERDKYVWNIILKFPFSSPLFRKEGLGGIFITSDFLRHRNSLLQYVPQGWEIDVDPSDLL